MSIFSNLFSRKLRNELLSAVDFAELIGKNAKIASDAYLKRADAEIPGFKALNTPPFAEVFLDKLGALGAFLRSEGSELGFLSSGLFGEKYNRPSSPESQYTKAHIHQEYKILRETLLALLAPHQGLSPKAATLLADLLEVSIAQATEEFVLNALAEKKRLTKDLHSAEKELSAAENQYRWFEEALNRLPKPLFLLDRQSGKISFANRSAKRMLGLDYVGQDAVDAYGSSFKVLDTNGNMIPQDQLPSSRTLRGESVKGEEFIIQSSMGSFHVKVFSEQLPEAFNQPASALVLLQDITSLKTVESSLRQTKANLDQAIEIAQIGFWHVEIPSSELFVTPILLAQFGIDASTFRSTLEECLAVIHPDDKERVSAAIDAAVYRKIPYRIEYRVVHSSGVIHWIEAKGAPTFDSGGNPIRFTGTTVDITTRVRARENLETTTRELQVLADSMPQIVWGSRPDGELDYFNQVWFDYSGSTYEENMGNGWAKFVHADDMAQTQALWAKALSSGELYENEFRLRSKNGVYRWFVVRAVPIFDGDGKIKTWYGTNTDIHEQKILTHELSEAKSIAERANAAKSQFLANMSHEIRTPLGAIMGFASLLRDETLAREEREGFLSVVERNSSQLLRIIDDILDLSKVEAGMMLIECIDFSLIEMLSDFASLIGFKAREKGIGFIARAVTPLPKIVNSDPTRLRQILMNVVGNAIKFTEQGQVELRVCFKDGVLDFEVEDTGRGISPDQEKNLFQPFSQADTSTTRLYGGTGLGLVLTRSLAEAMGGHFVLKQSVIGKGSQFSIKVEARTKPDVEYVTALGFASVPMRSVVSAGQLSGFKILLVEDSPDNQALISIFLSRAGAAIDIASDGEQGYRKASEGHYDLVLMDVQMPVLDGIAAVKRLRSDGYRGPVIALTAHAMKEERVRCIEAGFNDFISKPVIREDLVSAVARYRAN
ncbi:MAG: PAS domain-containing protein [Bdellovibrionota bacterium]